MAVENPPMFRAEVDDVAEVELSWLRTLGVRDATVAPLELGCAAHFDVLRFACRAAADLRNRAAHASYTLPKRAACGRSRSPSFSPESCIHKWAPVSLRLFAHYSDRLASQLF